MNVIKNVNASLPSACPVIAAICPGCNREGNLVPIGQDLQLVLQGGIQSKLKLLGVGSRQCPNPSCATHVFIVYEGSKIITTYPAGRIDFDAAGVPPKVAKAFEESLTCTANECYVAAAMLIRKTLEAVCEDRSAVGNNLKERIGDLRKKIVLPEELFIAMDHLRLLGNDAAHIESKTFDGIGKDEVEAAIELTKEVIKATYQYSGLVKKLQSLQKS